MPLEILLVAYVALGIAVALLARERGRSPWSWLFLAWLLSPVLALVILMLTPPERSAR